MKRYNEEYRMNAFRTWSLKSASITAFAYYGAALLVHVLVIAHALPYNWINGGQSASYAMQVNMSLISISSLLVLGTLTYLTTPFSKVRKGVWAKIILWLSVVFWTLSLVLQLLGTPFEKVVMAPLLLIGMISTIRLALGEQKSAE